MAWPDQRRLDASDSDHHGAGPCGRPRPWPGMPAGDGEAAADPARSRARGPGGSPWCSGVGAVIAVAAVYTARMMLAEHHRALAVAQLSRHPLTALAQTNAALALEGDSVITTTCAPPHWPAWAFIRTRAPPSMRAITRGPQDWVSWALLGDLAVRHHDYAAARRAYRRAPLLDPLGRSSYLRVAR